jgi:hypothetical protein
LGSGGEEEFDSRAGEDTLFHGETVFIITTGDFEDVSFELVSK